jgi:hypothetical protein
MTFIERLDHFDAGYYLAGNEPFFQARFTSETSDQHYVPVLTTDSPPFILTNTWRYNSVGERSRAPTAVSMDDKPPIS